MKGSTTVRGLQDVNFLILPKLNKRFNNLNQNPVWGVGDLS